MVITGNGCRGDVRSEARYIRSNDVAATGGDGTGVLQNLVLIADFGALL